jgi:hypothetical protein
MQVTLLELHGTAQTGLANAVVFGVFMHSIVWWGDAEKW